jgi:hypothetical protein
MLAGVGSIPPLKEEINIIGQLTKS